MSEDSGESRKSSYKVAGLVISGCFILLALIVFLLGNIEVKKKVVKQPEKEVRTEVSKKEDFSETSVYNNNEVSVDSNSLVLKVLKNENKLDYSVPELKTSGVVSSKSCYIQGSQVIYLLNIQIGAGTSCLDVKYYCSYDTYSSVNENDIVNVTYKQVSSSMFSVMSVSK